MRPKPTWCRQNCPGAAKAQGFAEDTGPSDPILAIILEAPGADEVQDGLAAQGPTGQALNDMLQKANLPRDRCLVMNVLRCRWGTNDYPGGALRKSCESACRYYDDGLRAFDPTHYIVCYHPASMFRTPQFRDWIKRCLRMARELVDEGHRPAVLMGDKAMQAFLPHLKGGVTAWIRHWEEVQCAKAALSNLTFPPTKPVPMANPE